MSGVAAMRQYLQLQPHHRGADQAWPYAPMSWPLARPPVPRWWGLTTGQWALLSLGIFALALVVGLLVYGPEAVMHLATGAKVWSRDLKDMLPAQERVSGAGSRLIQLHNAAGSVGGRNDPLSHDVTHTGPQVLAEGQSASPQIDLCEASLSSTSDVAIVPLHTAAVAAHKNPTSRTRRANEAAAASGELETKAALERLLGVPFVKVRPDWLRNPATGRNLEIDCYNESLGVCVEYNGIQHYVFPSAFHRTQEEFVAQQQRDQLKRRLCEARGLVFIVVPFTLKRKAIEAFLRGELQRCGLPIRLNRSSSTHTVP